MSRKVLMRIEIAVAGICAALTVAALISPTRLARRGHVRLRAGVAADRP